MSTLKIAISGGGIASLCLAHALCTAHPEWEIKIFESSAVLREEGAAVGLGSNAQQALSLISPSLREALSEAGGTKMEPSVRVMMGTGPDEGRHIGDIRSAISQIIVHRTAFWRALRKRVPEGVLEMGKKLQSVELSGTGSPIKLNFEDGTTYEADALIGCDGINSIVRKTILGPHHPAANPVYGPGYSHRVVVPLEEAIEAFGKEYCSLRTQQGWIGKDGFLLTDFNDEGKSMQVIAGWWSGEIWPHTRPYIEWSKERLRSDLAGWGDIGTAMTKIFTAQSTLYAAGSRVHLATPTYHKGPLCIAGDAALTFPPFQGAGAGQAIEDALILSAVLNSCSTRNDISYAFEVYDTIRRPRRTNVGETSTWAAALLTGRAPGIGMDVDKIAAVLPTWGHNIYSYDLVAAQDRALETTQQRISQ